MQQIEGTSSAANSGNVWILTDVYDPEPSTGFYAARLAEDLVAVAQVRVVTSGAQPVHQAGERGQPSVRQVLRVQHPGGGLARAACALAFTLLACVHVVRRARSGDVIVALTNPPFLPFAAWAVARMRGARFVVLVHDVYPELLSAIGLLDAHSLTMRLLRRAAGALHARADVTVVLGRDVQARLRARPGPAAGRIDIIENWVDSERPRPDPRSRVADRSARDLGGFVVLYMGNMGRAHDLPTLLDAARRLRGESDVQFVLIGRGHRYSVTRDAALGDDLPNVRVLPHCSDEDAAGWLNAADVAVIPLIPEVAGVSVPSRVYASLAAARPVIAATEPHGELAMLLGETGAGVTVRPGDPEALAEALLKLRDAPASREAMSTAARRAAEQRFTREESRRAWRALVADLMGQRATVAGSVVL